MGRLFGRILGLLAVMAVAYAGFNAWIAFVPPYHPATNWREELAPACKALDDLNISYDDLRCQMRVYEAGRLKAWPGVAARDGDTLTVFYRGKPSAHLIADPTGADYDGYDFRKALALYDPATKKPEQVAMVAGYHVGREHGEPEYRFLTLPDDSRWLVRDASASPDGRTVVEGDNKLQFDGHTTLYSWPDRQALARFDVGCRVLSWQDDTHFRATCIRSMDDMAFGDIPFADILTPPPAFDARVWRDKAGRWQMQATRWLIGRPTYNRDADFEWPPAFSLFWLPHYTAKAG